MLTAGYLSGREAEINQPKNLTLSSSRPAIQQEFSRGRPSRLCLNRMRAMPLTSKMSMKGCAKKIRTQCWWGVGITSLEYEEGQDVVFTMEPWGWQFGTVVNDMRGIPELGVWRNVWTVLRVGGWDEANHQVINCHKWGHWRQMFEILLHEPPRTSETWMWWAIFVGALMKTLWLAKAWEPGGTRETYSYLLKTSWLVLWNYLNECSKSVHGSCVNLMITWWEITPCGWSRNILCHQRHTLVYLNVIQVADEKNSWARRWKQQREREPLDLGIRLKAPNSP